MKILPDSVIGNMQEFESRVTGSIPVPVTNGGCSLSGKASHCECEEQGSIPGDNQKVAYSSTDKNTALRTQR
jgi:hypothetical protein